MYFLSSDISPTFHTYVFFSIIFDKMACSPLCFAVMCASGRAPLRLCPLNTTTAALPINWLSSIPCQVCLILSCLTSCYLKSHLPKPLNPLVTHNNKKLARCSLNEDRVVEIWWGMEDLQTPDRHTALCKSVIALPQFIFSKRSKVLFSYLFSVIFLYLLKAYCAMFAWTMLLLFIYLLKTATRLIKLPCG